MKPIIPMSAFKARREKLLASIGDAVLVLTAAKEKIRNRDCAFPYRQDSDFFYLTNFNESGAVLLLDGKNKESILFSKPYDELHAIWEGEIIGQERAEKEYLFDKAYPIELLEEKLLAYFFANDTIISPFSRYGDFDSLLLKLVGQAKNTRRARAPQNWLHSDQFIHPMRMIKDKYEIELMCYAGNISVNAHAAAMAHTQPEMNESEVAALLDFHFNKVGNGAAYGHIVAGGNNGCTLHYGANNCQLNDGDLLLIDAGCEIDGYASDISRTFPVNGHFSPIQKRVYEWVLKALAAGLEQCRAGNTILSPHIAAQKVLIEGMLDLGLLTGSYDEIIASNAHQRYYMHGTSHWMGIDVHDVGDYQDSDDNPLMLKEGMSLTVEPGLYIRKDDEQAPAELRGIGIRIEDDVIITADGHINLTSHTPKSVEDVEKACQSSYSI